MSIGSVRSPLNLARFEMEVSSNAFLGFVYGAVHEKGSQEQIHENIQEIEDRFTCVVQVWKKSLESFNQYKETHKVLPEWKGNLGKSKILDPKPDTLSSFYDSQMMRLNSLIHQVTAARMAARKSLSLDQVTLALVQLDSFSQDFNQFICVENEDRSRKQLVAKLQKIDLCYKKVVQAWRNSLDALSTFKEIHEKIPEWNGKELESLSDFYNRKTKLVNSLFYEASQNRNAADMVLNNELRNLAKLRT